MSAFTGACYESFYISIVINPAVCKLYIRGRRCTSDVYIIKIRRPRNDFVSQRKAYFAAESVQRSVREVYANGEDQFNALKSEASMRTALFQYFINHQDEGQLIVIENLDHIPHLQYEEAGATVTKFVKGREEGRYGFLNDVI